MKRRPTALITIAAVAVLAIALAGSRLPAALAHGIGTPQVLNAPAGPYMLSAWTDPDPLRADETHVVVAVIDPDTREMIVSGVEVAVTMTSLDAPSVILREVAGTDSVNQLLYAAEFNGQVSEGAWRVGVVATGAQGTSDEVTFEVEIDPARGNRWLWIGLGGMAVLVAGWLFLSMQPEQPARAARRRRAAR